MSLTSMYFLILAVLLIPIFYLVPKKGQWIVLLISSVTFYVFSGWTNIFYVLFATLSSFLATTSMQKLTDKQKKYIKENKATLSKDDKKLYKQKIKSKRKAIMLVCIILNVCILLFFKLYLRLKNSINALDSWDIIVPLGLSYFTLQTIGYVVDVYWNNVEAEKNPLKVLLFVSFFPQMTQGPISDFKQLTGELFKEHNLTYENFSRGFQRLLWGYFKKIMVATLMSPYVSEIFENYRDYSGIMLFVGMFVVMIQLYADFSGYMDIVCGLCEMLDIKLSENFNHPFISKSLSEFWRRWHITLGAWFKKYVFFTVGTSKFAGSISKKIKEKHGSDAAEKVVSTIALSAIWISIGAWHSLFAPFVLWGLLNGIIMIFSVWMEPVYAKTKLKLNIKEESKIFNLFRIARTFALVSALEVFSDIGSLKDGLNYFVKMITNIPMGLGLKSSFLFTTGGTKDLLIMAACFALMAFVDVCSLKCQFRDKFNKVHFLIRIIILLFIFALLAIVGIHTLVESDGGFMYAQF